ncbi:MAG: MlaD family protein, partial [Actinomycetota bacterium]|nr:MlaD family protein [Actinomycetota bacterium]
MIRTRRARIGLSVTLVALVVAGFGTVSALGADRERIRVTAYFDNSNGIYPGDEIRILGVPVGEISSIEPQPQDAKVTFWVDRVVAV